MKKNQKTAGPGTSTKRAPHLAFDLPAVLLGAGGRSCIAFAAGRKYLQAVFMGEPIAVESVPLESIKFDRAVLKGKAYPVRRAARIYLKSQISKTDRAKRILRALAKGETEVLA
jgi:hypothetical protein